MTIGVEEQPVVVLTGAAGTLGQAIAAELVRRGARLALVDRDARGLEELRASLGAGARSVSIVADLIKEGDLERATRAALAAFGRLDVLVNNAGVEGPIGPLEDVQMDDVLCVYQLNVFVAMRLMQALIPHFRTQGAGRIVNMASGAGLAGSAYMSAYSSSKHAVIGLTRSVAAELAGSGISVNAICPGCVESPMMSRIEADLARRRGSSPYSFVSSIPAARFAAPAEVANLVAYLALDAPSYLTGAALVIDGAMRA